MTSIVVGSIVGSIIGRLIFLLYRFLKESKHD